MTARHRRTTLLATALLLLSAAVRPAVAHAQSGAGDGFLFHAPQAALSLRLGRAWPSANSRVFDFTAQQLTLNRGHFAGFSAAADLDVTLTHRFALQLGAAVSSREAGSEYRDFVDNKDLPIEQRTTFERAPLTLGLKWFAKSPGRSLGRFAWVPSKFAPYVAGGVGMMYYRFHQTGDFVDFSNFDVFHSTMESSGWTNMAYGATGVDYALSTRLGLLTEARYERAHGPMSSDFVGFDRIDLSGVSVTAGLHLRF